MEITRQEYKFSRSGGMVERGQHSYGSNSCVRDCPDCYGGGHRGLLKCNNCKGTGKVNEMIKWECPNCGNIAESSDVYDEKICPKCQAHMSTDKPHGQEKLYSKGTGKVENVKDQKWECMDCGEKWMPRSTPNRCPECGSSHIEEDE